MHPLSVETRDVVDAYWASALGCSPARLNAPGTAIVPRTGLGEYHGLIIFARGDSVVASVPPSRKAAFLAKLGGFTAEEVRSEEKLKQAIGEPIEEFIGPAFIGYCDQGTFRANISHTARMLEERDRPAFEALRDAVPPEEWEYGGSDLEDHPLAGQFDDEGRLLAMAGYSVWNESIAHLSVLTHPAHRGRGLGCGVVSAITAHALDHGLIPQYRTLASNEPSMQLARSLGFHPYAVSVAVRLTRPA